MTDLNPHRGVLILVLGIVSVVACQPLGVVPWVMGKSDLKEIDAGRMDREGRGLTQAGMVLGIVGVGLTVLGVLMFVGALLFSLLLAAGAQ